MRLAQQFPASPSHIMGREGSEMHIHAEDVDAYARKRDSESQRLEVEAHLANCESCRSRVAAAVDFSRALTQLHREAIEMRESHRTPTDEHATLRVLTPMSPDHWDVRIRDVSKGGMCVRTPKAIDRGSKVEVRRGAIVAYGEARYCIQVGEMFHVGIRLSEASPGALKDK
jgi:hypothetical protein